MARTRYIKPDFFEDEDLAELPHWIRLLYAGLWILADKAGRLQDKPLWIKIKLFPYENIDIEEGLKVLATIKKHGKYPFIQRYAIENTNYIQILKWLEHQKPHHQEPETKIPEPPPIKETLTSTLTSTITIRKHLQHLRTPSENLRTKTKVLDFIHLTEDEITKLKEKLGEDSYPQIINNLNNYIGSTGKRYKSHYFTILSWHNRKTDKHHGIKKWLSKQQEVKE